MKQLLWKIIVLTAVLCLFAAVGAQAEAVGGTTVKVGSVTELTGLVSQINAEGAAAFAADKESRMQRVNIEITANLQLTERVTFQNGTNVHIYSTPGQQYTIKPFTPVSNNPLISMGDTMFRTVGTAYLAFSDLIIDGDSNNCSFLTLAGSEVLLGGNLTVQNFNIVGLNAPMYPLISAQSTNANAGIDNDNPYHVDPKLTIRDCQFLNNNSPNGGVARIVDGEVTVEDSLFQNNTAKQYVAFGGKVSGEGGGALHLNRSTATITNSRFIGNKSELSGGAVQVFNDSEVIFTDCVFTDNEAATHGGAICVSDAFDDNSSLASIITLNNCTLTGNKANGNDAGDNYASSPEAAGGGAIFLHEFCEAYLNEGTVLSQNESADEGGAVYVCFGAQLFMNGARIENNTAATNGGGVFLDGTNAYRGYLHDREGTVPTKDDAYAAGGKFFLTDGLIYRNIAGQNGGGVYIGGENEVEVNGEVRRFVGGEMLMSGGVITENQAMDMGGGVYVGASGNEDIGGRLDMIGGTIHENIAGQDGNASTGLNDAGAEIFSVGRTSFISVVEASEITTYIQDTRNTFVPESHRSLYYDDWYDDYSDQDPDFGKPPYKIGTDPNTGRYTSSIEPARMVYQTKNEDSDYNALILGFKTSVDDGSTVPPIPSDVPGETVPQTGDSFTPGLYAVLILMSIGAYLFLRRYAFR